MKNKKRILGVLALVVCAALLAGLYLAFAPKGATGEKRLSVTIVSAGGATRAVELRTRQEFLRGALEEQALIQGEEGAYGLFVTTVDGYTARDDRQEWWCFTKGSETLMTGVDATPVGDGDRFEITLTQGY